MRWKPSRSSGIMFAKYDNKSRKNRDEMQRMIENNEYLSFANMNKFSKHVYLYWLNENKKFADLSGRSFANRRLISECVGFTIIYDMLLRHVDKLYKPLQKHLASNIIKRGRAENFTGFGI